jgi:DUF1680 family protein
MDKQTFGPVKLSPNAHTHSFPVTFDGVKIISESRLGKWQQLNSESTVSHLIDNLLSTGALANIQKVNKPDFKFTGMWFSDSDIHKSLEAICWSLYHRTDKKQLDFYDLATKAIAEAQDETGYVYSYFQMVEPDYRWKNFGWGHELYTAGHLIQAAVAESRVLGSTSLMEIATKFADLIVDKFSQPGTLQMCGHPEIETALIELYRETGNTRYLDMAEKMIRGRGFQKIRDAKALGLFHMSPSYMQDHLPVEEQISAVGHSVRQLYLNAAVVDLYTEKGDKNLLETQERQWEDIVYSKMYVTGGLGSRHKDEAFGDSYELPNDRAYAETCASIANFMWSWRLLLATGKARYADVMELSLYNILEGSLSSDGCKFFYSNPLQYRTGHFVAFDTDASERLPWFTCSCCPPNIARVIATLQHYLLSVEENSVALHLYAAAEVKVTTPSGENVEFSVTTNYPDDGKINIKVVSPGQFGINLRIPEWSKNHTILINSSKVDVAINKNGYLELDREWKTGDIVSLDLQMRSEFLLPHPRIDASRGAVALRRGPVVYAIENADVPSASYFVDDFAVDISSPIEEAVVNLPNYGDSPALSIKGHFVTYSNNDAYPYAATPPLITSEEIRITAVPYARWGNRTKGGMRVWIPIQLDYVSK